ncbi:hypothetical protein [Sphingomonas oligophenolica]|uniref:hypothetical protein n=1 Tax=Sphingomonas oligophenolica TaxID=301154 RepID=UPI003D04B0F0
MFDKEIKDEIFTLGTLGYTDPSSGIFYKNAIVSTPVNASSARIRGVEGNVIINSFADISPLLSGFGASANASLLDGRVAVSAQRRWDADDQQAGWAAQLRDQRVAFLYAEGSGVCVPPSIVRGARCASSRPM